MGITKFDLEELAESSLPAFITRDEVVAAGTIELTVEKGQKEFPTNERNTNKVNVTGTIRNGKRTERRTVALAEWQINRLAQELGAKSPADFGGETLYLHPATLQKGPYKGTKVINASLEKPKAA